MTRIHLRIIISPSNPHFANFLLLERPHQKQSDGWSQYKSSHHVRTVVSVLWDSVEAGEEGRTERAQTEHGLGQTAGLGLDGAGDVHLERRVGGRHKAVNIRKLFTTSRRFKKNPCAPL